MAIYISYDDRIFLLFHIMPYHLYCVVCHNLLGNFWIIWTTGMSLPNPYHLCLTRTGINDSSYWKKSIVFACHIEFSLQSFPVFGSTLLAKYLIYEILVYISISYNCWYPVTWCFSTYSFRSLWIELWSLTYFAFFSQSYHSKSAESKNNGLFVLVA